MFTFPALPQVDEMIVGKSWDAMNPLKDEEELIGQWFACIFKNIKTPNLYIKKKEKDSNCGSQLIRLHSSCQNGLIAVEVRSNRLHFPKA